MEAQMNRTQINHWWKVALLVAGRFQPGAQDKNENFSKATNRIRDSAERLKRLDRLHDLASSRDWLGARRIVVCDCQRAIEQTERLLKEVSQVVAELSKAKQVNSKEVFLDLMAIHREFDELCFNAKEQLLSVVTKDIRLEDTFLGAFRIELHLDSLAASSNGLYEIVAVEPQASAPNDSVTHPHVEANRLCEGDAKPAIRMALQQGRLFDFFQIVEQVLNTYSSDSAYVQLSEWDGVRCNHCGYNSSLEDSRDCSKCDTSICDECVRECESCNDLFCGDCPEACDDCCDVICKSCTTTCEGCAEIFCNNCINENERCQPCEEKFKEESDSGSNEVEVHSDGVGQTVVPA